jgi:hypothetical protein
LAKKYKLKHSVSLNQIGFAYAHFAELLQERKSKSNHLELKFAFTRMKIISARLALTEAFKNAGKDANRRLPTADCRLFPFLFIFAQNYQNMDLSKILSIAGKQGLFKVVSQGKNSVIVESLIDGKRFPAFGNEKMSSLEEISVFTTGEDKPLKEVIRALYEKLEGKPGIDPKSGNAELKKFFLEMVPDFDQDRVYPSDIRKMISWYNSLLEKDLLDFTEQPEEPTETEVSAETDGTDEETTDKA